MWINLIDVCTRITLERRYWRSDRIWATSFAFNTPLKFIPFWFDRLALKRSQYWSPSQLHELQTGRLQRLSLKASELPFWSEAFKEAGFDPHQFSFESFRRIPPITRRDFSQFTEEDYVVSSLKDRSFPDQTSGSTGSPFRFLLDKGAVLRSYAVRDRMFRVATRGIRYHIVTLRALERIGLSFYKDYFFYIRGSYSVKHRIGDLAELVNERFPKGVVLYAIASWILALVREVEKSDIRFPVRAIVSAGEGMRPAEREYVERVLRTRLFLAYGSQESSCIAFECEHKKLHINEEELYIEILDDADNPVPAGVTGRIVVTQFDNRVMPFIRYANGDVGSIAQEPCRCGRTLRTITLLGRQKDVIQLPEDREVALIDLSPIFDSFFNEVRQYQIVQKSRTRFLIRVVATEAFEASKSSLAARLVRALHPSAVIEWERVEAIPYAKSGKALYFVKELESSI